MSGRRKDKPKGVHIDTGQQICTVYIPWTVHHFTGIGNSAGGVDRYRVFLDAYIIS